MSKPSHQNPIGGRMDWALVAQDQLNEMGAIMQSRCYNGDGIYMQSFRTW
jgi:hypothetical protein